MHKVSFTLLLLVILALTACVSAPQPPPATRPVEGQPTEAVAEKPPEESMEEEAAKAEPIKIGVPIPTTGALASNGQDVKTGIELFFNSIDNKIGDRPVELLFVDTAADPQQALDQARRLVEQAKVDFLLGIVSSSVAVPLAQYVDEQGIPLVVTVAGGTPVITGPDRSPYVFRTSITTRQLEPPFGWYVATKLGVEQAATFAWDFSAGHGRAEAFAAAFGDAGGSVVTQQWPPLGTSDYGPFISQIDPADVDVVYAFFAGPGAISFVQQMRQFGLTPDLQVVGPGFLTEGEVLQSQGEAAVGIISATHYTPVLDNPENEKFVQLYRAKAGGEPGTYVEAGYLGASVAVRAIEAVDGDLSDTQQFLDALTAVEFNTPSGPFRFDDRGQSVRNVYITRVIEAEDGSVTHEVVDTIEQVSQDWAPQ